MLPVSAAPQRTGRPGAAESTRPSALPGESGHHWRFPTETASTRGEPQYARVRVLERGRMMQSQTVEKLFGIGALSFSLSVATGVALAQSAPTRSLLALSKRDHTLAIV